MTKEKERRQNDEDIAILKRTMFGEQINRGNRTKGVFEKTNIMWEQFVFMFRIYKVMMIFITLIVGGIIAILIKLFIGGI